VAIQPYPTNVDLERLGCTGSARRFIVNITGTESSNTMKIYSGGSPSYPELVIYSGAVRNSVLLTSYPSTNLLNIRVKLDEGSSFYTSLRNAKCAGTVHPRPLD